MNFNGVSFEKVEFQDLTNCNALDDYLFKIGVLISLRSGKREQLKDFFASCSQKLDNQLKVMMYFPFLGENADVATYLKKNGLPLKTRLKIQSAFRQKKFIRQTKQEVLRLVDIFQNKEELKSPEKRQIQLAAVKSLTHVFFKNLFSLHLAINAKNQPWSIKLKRELSKFSPYWNLIRGFSFSTEELLKIRDYLLLVMNDYQETFEDQEGIKILAEKFTQMGHTQEFRTIRSRSGADWSLSQLRERFKNPLLKSEFFDFWYMVMMNRTSDAELRQKFRQAIHKRSLQQARPGQLWVFQYFFPPDDELRKIILDKLLSFWRSPVQINRYTVLRTLEFNKVKQAMSARDAYFKKANFQIKREFFTELLNSGYSTENALYELFLLGDKNEENLWWLII